MRIPRRAVALVAAGLLGCDSGTGPGESVDGMPPEGLDPAPRVLVFDMLHEGQRDIFRVELDGSGLTRLTEDPGEDIAPTAAGDHVVFTSFRDGRAQLYAVPLDGGDAVRVTEGAASHTDPSLSPDAGLAYVSDASGSPRLWIAEEIGAEPGRLTDGFGHGAALELSPGWSPDGDRLVFVSTTRGNSDLWVADLENDTLYSLVSGSATYLHPAWGPGGDIAFTSDRNGDLGIHWIRSPGLVDRLTPGWERAGEPAWLDADTLVYVTFDVDGGTRLRWLETTGSAGDDIPLPVGMDPRRPAVRR